MHDISQLRFHSTLDAPTKEQDAYWFILQAEKLVVQATGNGVSVLVATTPKIFGLTPLREQYLGYLHNEDGSCIHCYSAEISATTELPAGLLADGLRPLYNQLPDALFALAGRAIQIVDWDRNHQFCGRCGEAIYAMENERAKQCGQCKLTSYPRLSPAVIVAITRPGDAGNEILLARNHRFPPGLYSVLAGFVEPGESLEECVAREVFEEVGIQVTDICYFGSQPWPFPNSLMLGFTAYYASGDLQLEEAEIADAQWFSPGNLPQLPPKMSIARQLIEHFIAENR